VKECRQERRTWVILTKCRVLVWERYFRKDFSERKEEDVAESQQLISLP